MNQKKKNDDDKTKKNNKRKIGFKQEKKRFYQHKELQHPAE